MKLTDKQPVASPWPDWAPTDLTTAYPMIRGLSSKKWIPLDESEFFMRRLKGMKPSDYLVGIGTQTKCVGVVEKLAIDLRMKPVWDRLSKLEDDVKSGKISSFLSSRDNESVSCAIARRCVSGLHDAATMRPLTRQRWKTRHLEISKLARRLAALLLPDRFVDSDLRQLAWLFTPEALHVFASEVYFHSGPHVYRSREGEDPGNPETYQKRSQEEIDQDEAEWDKGVENLEYWLKDAIERGAPRFDQLLHRLAEHSDTVSRNPPFLSPTSRKQREVFNISGSLSMYFSQIFLKPLDEVVATITEVVTDTEITAAAVKIRRHRWLKHRKRPIR